jgi:hypothetical protein
MKPKFFFSFLFSKESCSSVSQHLGLGSILVLMVRPCKVRWGKGICDASVHKLASTRISKHEGGGQNYQYIVNPTVTIYSNFLLNLL